MSVTVGSPGSSSRRVSLPRPKSSTFTAPSVPTITLGRLDIAVDDAARMCCGAGVGDRDRNPERLVQAHPLTWNERIQARAADVLHHMKSLSSADSIS
jgi:hypothetical protein